MNNFEANYKKILEVLQSITEEMNFLNQKRKPRLSDIELISIDLTSIYMSIDSEYQLFRVLPNSLKTRIERSVYNRRKRALFYHRDSLRKVLANKISTQDYFIVDSMPLEVYKLSRSSRSLICKEDYQTAPNKGYCASQSTNYYAKTFDGFKNRILSKIMALTVIQLINKLNNRNINNLKISIA